jgi:hypothetical protein
LRLRSGLKYGVDNISFAAVNATKGKNLFGDTNLRPSQPDSFNVVHGVKHIVDQFGKLPIKNGDRFTFAAKNGVAYGTDTQNCHMSP